MLVCNAMFHNLADCIMGPGLKKRKTATVPIDTTVVRPTIERLTSNPLVVASPSTRESAAGKFISFNPLVSV